MRGALIGTAVAAALLTIAATVHAQAPAGVGAVGLDAPAAAAAAACRSLATAWRADGAVPAVIDVGDAARPVTVIAPLSGTAMMDEAPALQATFDAAPSGAVILFPPGVRLSRSDVVTVRTPGLLLCGYDATLFAAAERRAALEIDADGVAIVGLTFEAPPTAFTDWPERWSAHRDSGLPTKFPDGDSKSYGWASNHIVARAVRDMIVRDVIALGARRGGVRLYGTRNALVEGSCFYRSFSDGVHVVHGARDVTVRGNRIIGVGDDCISIVTYDRDKYPETVRSVRVEGNLCQGSRARGLTIIGGDDVAILDNEVRDVLVAGILVHPSPEYNTYPVNNVTVDGNLIDGAGLRRDSCNNCGDIVVNDDWRRPVTNILIENNVVAIHRPRGAPIRPLPSCIAAWTTTKSGPAGQPLK